MTDLHHENKNAQPENAQPAVSGSLKTQVSPQDTLSAKKHRTIVIWLRVIALLFVGLFFLSQCAMNKPKAKAAIVQSCIKNVPFAARWQADLAAKNLQDPNGKLVAQYCVCMWDEPLQKLSDKQIQSFAKISTQEQLDLLGGDAAFAARDKQCVANLK